MAKRSGLNFNKKRRKIETAVLKEVFSWIMGIFVAVLLAFVLVYCVGMTTSVIGISMKPTLENSEKIMVNRFVYMISSPKLNDVIVFVPNGSMNSHYYVKRVVGTPGDTVQIIDGHLYINEELFVYEDDYDEMAQAGIAENAITLKKGEYFVLGDNRNNSEDSRSANIGIVNKKNIIGKAWLHLGAGENTIGFVK
ncbi:MAG: signal peptidase I [Lachnospiraceae bacterium]|nr:signal peptidase I [Lachnospiraceae bacterium]